MTSETLIPLGAVVLAAGAMYQAGMLAGRFNKHEELVEKRLDMLESENKKRVTREELDARFGIITERLDAIHEKLDLLATGR